MKAIIFSDTHYHDWQPFSAPTEHGYGTRFAEQLRLFDVLERMAEEERPDCFLFGGDIFQRRGNLFVPVVAHVREGFARLAAIAPVIAAEGNHDQPTRGSGGGADRSALHLISGPHTQLGTLAGGSIVAERAGVLIAAVPFSEERQEWLDMVDACRRSMKGRAPKILLTHYGMQEFPLLANDTVVVNRGATTIAEAGTRAYDISLFGHYHIPHLHAPGLNGTDLGGAAAHVSIGAPFHFTAGDEGRPGGVWVLTVTPMLRGDAAISIRHVPLVSEAAGDDRPFRRFVVRRVNPIAEKKARRPLAEQVDPQAYERWIVDPSHVAPGTEFPPGVQVVLAKDDVAMIPTAGRRERGEAEAFDPERIVADYARFAAVAAGEEQRTDPEVLRAFGVEFVKRCMAEEAAGPDRSAWDVPSGSSLTLRRVVARNFMSIAEVAFLPSSRGLLHLFGGNRQGKSALTEAIYWCLFDQTIRGIKKDEVVRAGSRDGCRVETDIEIGGDNPFTARVVRCRKDVADGTDVWIEDSRIPGKRIKGADTDATTAMIADLLGCSATGYQQTAYFTAAGTSVALLKADEIKRLFDKLLPLGWLRGGETELRELAKGTADSIAKIGAEIVVHRARIEENTQALGMLDNMAEEDRRRRVAEMARYLTKILEAEAEAGVGQKKLRASLNVAQAERDAAKKLLDGAKARKIDADRDLLDAETAERKARGDADGARKEQAQRYRAYADASAAAEHLEREVAKPEAMLKKAGGKAVCPTCLNEVTQKHAERVRAAHAEQIAAAGEALREANTARKAADARLVRCEEEVNVAALAAQEARKAVNKINVPAAEAAHKAAERDCNRIDDDIFMLKGETTKRVAEYRAEIHRLEAAPEDFKAHAGTLRAAIAGAQEDIVGAESEAEALAGDARVVEYWLKAFASGIRTMFLSRITDTLNEAAREISMDLADGVFDIRFSTVETLKGGGVREKFNLQVETRDGSTGYRADSTGGRALIDFAVNLSLLRVARAYAPRKLNWQIYDEAFLGVDPPTLERITGYLAYIGLDNLVIFMSHDVTAQHNGRMVRVSKGAEGSVYDDVHRIEM